MIEGETVEATTIIIGIHGNCKIGTMQGSNPQEKQKDLNVSPPCRKTDQTAEAQSRHLKSSLSRECSKMFGH